LITHTVAVRAVVWSLLGLGFLRQKKRGRFAGSINWIARYFTGSPGSQEFPGAYWLYQFNWVKLTGSRRRSVPNFEQLVQCSSCHKVDQFTPLAGLATVLDTTRRHSNPLASTRECATLSDDTRLDSSSTRPLVCITEANSQSSRCSSSDWAPFSRISLTSRISAGLVHDGFVEV
jgi:hypothetical protein